MIELLKCPYAGCGTDVDVDVGTFDGSILDCHACDQEIYVIVDDDGTVELEAVGDRRVETVLEWVYNPDDDPQREALTEAERNPSINDGGSGMS